MDHAEEVKIDGVELALRSSLGEKHFDDKKKMKQHLAKIFGQYDTSGSGNLSYNEFETALMRDLNLVGCRNELRGLFERYDDDCSETLSMSEFINSVCGRPAKVNPEAKSIVERVKNLIISRGGSNGIRTMTAILRRLDANGNKKIDQDELKQGLDVYGIRPTKQEMEKIMAYFDRDGDGSISVTEFLRGIRGRMDRSRVQFVKKAYALLDKNGDGVTLADIRTAYDVSQNPNVLEGKITEEEALHEFISTWDRNHDDKVTWEEFLDYYKDLSVGIDSSEYFELMMRNAWHIAGGEGAAANTTDLRVLVTHGDGSQSIEEIQNDLGLDHRDMEEMKKRLKQQGVQDIKEISLSK